MRSADSSTLFERAVTAALASSGVIAVSYVFVEDSPARILWPVFGLAALLIALVGRRRGFPASMLKSIPPHLASFLAVFVPTITFLSFALYAVVGASGIIVGMALPTSLLVLISASTAASLLNLVTLLINLRHLYGTRQRS